MLCFVSNLTEKKKEKDMINDFTDKHFHYFLTHLLYIKR